MGVLDRAAHLHEQLQSLADAEEVLAVDEALDGLAATDAQAAELVKLRYFGGLTIDEAANALGISAATAERHWAFARAWLYRAITGNDRPSAVSPH